MHRNRVVAFKGLLSGVGARVGGQGAILGEALVATGEVAFKRLLSSVNSLVRGQFATLLK